MTVPATPAAIAKVKTRLREAGQRNNTADLATMRELHDSLSQCEDQANKGGLADLKVRLTTIRERLLGLMGNGQPAPAEPVTTKAPDQPTEAGGFGSGGYTDDNPDADDTADEGTDVNDNDLVRQAVAAQYPEFTIQSIDDDNVYGEMAGKRYQIGYDIDDDSKNVDLDSPEPIDDDSAATEYQDSYEEGAHEGQVDFGDTITPLSESGDLTLTAGPKGSVDAIVTIIRPGFGNGRDKFYYPTETLRRDISKFVGRKMFCDHQSSDEETRHPERRVKDWVATCREAWFDEASQTAKGKVRLYDPWLIERARQAPDEIALSIRAGGVAKPGKIDGREARIIEAIMVAKSIDFVTYAGAGGRLDRLIESAGGTGNGTESPATKGHNPMEWDKVTLEDLRKARPDLIESATQVAIREATSGTAIETMEARFGAQIAELKEAVSAERTKSAKAEAGVLVAEICETDLKASKEATRYLKNRFREAIVGEGGYKSRAELKEALSQELDELKAVAVGFKSPVTGMGESQEPKHQTSREARTADFGKLVGYAKVAG